MNGIGIGGGTYTVPRFDELYNQPPCCSMIFQLLTDMEYLKAYGIGCLLTSFLFCLIGFFNGISKTKFAMVQEIPGPSGPRCRCPSCSAISNL